jgi:hypothetical protein
MPQAAIVPVEQQAIERSVERFPGPARDGLEQRWDRFGSVEPTVIVIVNPVGLLIARRPDRLPEHLDVVVLGRVQIPEHLEPHAVDAEFLREIPGMEGMTVIQPVEFEARVGDQLLDWS